MPPGGVFEADGDVALRVALLKIGGGRDALLTEAEDGGDGFERAGGAEGVAVE